MPSQQEQLALLAQLEQALPQQNPLEQLAQLAQLEGYKQNQQRLDAQLLLQQLGFQANQDQRGFSNELARDQFGLAQEQEQRLGQQQGVSNRFAQQGLDLQQQQEERLGSMVPLQQLLLAAQAQNTGLQSEKLQQLLDLFRSFGQPQQNAVPNANVFFEAINQPLTTP